jgi:alcohol dehydrogenase
VITDKGVRSTGLVDKIVTYLKDTSLQIVIFDGVLPDPPDTMVDVCADLFRAEKCDGIVGIGGGSTLDTAKAIKKMSRNEGKCSSFLYDFSYGPNPGVPLITIPTTSGTGAEVSSAAVITISEFGVKGGIANILADLAIIDPLFCEGMPSYITATTGMDALAHAVEELLTPQHNLNIDVLAGHAVELIFRSLKKAVDNGSDLDARFDMCYAAYIGGLGICEVYLPFGHAIAHTIGAKKHIAHGALCAVATPCTIRFLGPHYPEKMKIMAKAMKIPLDENTGTEELVKKCADAVVALRKSMGLKNYKELGLTMADLDELAAESLNEVSMNFACYDPTKEDILELFKEYYDI